MCKHTPFGTILALLSQKIKKKLSKAVKDNFQKSENES